MSQYRRPITVVGCIALLMGEDKAKTQAFVSDFHGDRFPADLKKQLVDELSRHLRMLKMAEMVDEEFDTLVRRTIQPLELFAEMQVNRAQRRELSAKLNHVRGVLGLE